MQNAFFLIVVLGPPQAKTESEFIHIGPQEEPLDSTTKALQELEAGVNANARRYNELRMQAEKKQKELDKLLVSGPQAGARP